MSIGQIKNKQSGVASVEVALIMPFIFLLMLGGIELARTVYQYNTLVKNLRDATKYVASAVRPINYNTVGSTDPEVIRYKAVIDEAGNLAMCGTTTACSSSSVNGLTLENIKLKYPDSIEVDGVTFTFVQMYIEDFSLGFVFNLFGDSLALSDITYTMYQLQQN
ncbi:MAG: TadE/TadG family type IV pilus assembly protein [Pseudomonadota bacterium]